jgi:transposase
LPNGSDSDLLAFMAEAHPAELRRRVVEAYENGEGSYPEVASRFAVGEASVKRWVLLFIKTGRVEPQQKAGGRFSTIEETAVKALVKKLGDPTAGELTAAFNETRRGKARVHVSSMKRALHRFGYVVKKSADGRWRVCGRTS